MVNKINSIKQGFLFLILLVTFSSCNRFLEIYTASTNDKSIKLNNDNYYVYENDTIKVVYYFWDNCGIMSFIVENKSNKPIYIDWKRSSYIFNGGKYDYYEEGSVTDFVNSGSTYNGAFGIKYGNSTTVSTSIKTERVMFLPPHGGIRKTSYHIFEGIIKPPKGSNAINELKRKGTCGFNVDLSSNKVEFRNFITYSTTENFDKEQYVDNTFYINSVRVVHDISNDDNNSNADNLVIKSSPNSFYVNGIKKRSLR